MLNRTRSVIPIFEIVGSHIVNTFYNKLYRKAVEDTRKGQHKSITDGYRYIIGVYVSSISDTSAQYCNEEIISMHNYYQTNHRGGVVVQFAEFEDQFLKQIIPKNYFISFTSMDKDRVLREVIIKVILEFAKEILDSKSKGKVPLICKIVDAHTDQANVVELQNIAYSLLILRREEYYSGFAQEHIREKLPPGSATNVDVFNRLKSEYAIEMKKRMEAEAELRKAKRVIDQLADTARNQHKKIMDLEVRISSNTNKNIQAPQQEYIAPPIRSRSKTPAPPRFRLDSAEDSESSSSSAENEQQGIFGDDDDFDRDAGFGI